MRTRVLLGLLSLLFLTGCPLTFERGKNLLVDNGDFSGTWELTKVRSTLGGVVDKCDDVVFTLSQTETELVIDAREFRCASGTYYPSLPLISLDRSGSKLTSDGEPAGVLLTNSLIITWKLGTNLLLELELAPENRVMRYKESFRGWQISADAVRP